MVRQVGARLSFSSGAATGERNADSSFLHYSAKKYPTHVLRTPITRAAPGQAAASSLSSAFCSTDLQRASSLALRSFSVRNSAAEMGASSRPLESGPSA